MPTNRLEAFSDGVLAIIITVMVLQLKLPQEPSLAGLWDAAGSGLLSYLLSFVYVGIYWNNHHHLLHAAERVSGGALWANLNLLFWLSLLPFTTGWISESGFARFPVLCYGACLLLAAVAYEVLERALVRAEGPGSRVHEMLRRSSARMAGIDRKELISIGLYCAGILASLLESVALPAPFGTAIAMGCYVLVALLWLVPDRRFEREYASRDGDS